MKTRKLINQLITKKRVYKILKYYLSKTDKYDFETKKLLRTKAELYLQEV